MTKIERVWASKSFSFSSQAWKLFSTSVSTGWLVTISCVIPVSSVQNADNCGLAVGVTSETRLLHVSSKKIDAATDMYGKSSHIPEFVHWFSIREIRWFPGDEFFSHYRKSPRNPVRESNRSFAWRLKSPCAMVIGRTCTLSESIDCKVQTSLYRYVIFTSWRNSC